MTYNSDAAVEHWWREAYQRGAAAPHMIRDFPTQRYFLLVCDADEVPTPSFLSVLQRQPREMRANIHQPGSETLPKESINGALFLKMAMYVFSWAWTSGEDWYKPYVTTDAVVRQLVAYPR